MADYEKKYGITEDESVIYFHKSRRMFCIKDDKLIIAKPNLPYSHAIWFELEGWMDDADDSFMSDTTRGFVSQSGDIYFYKGYKFIIDEKSEKDIFEHLIELKILLNLEPISKIFGGKNPLKFFGMLKDFC